MFVLKTHPCFGIGIFALAFARKAALPTIGIEHGPGGMPIHFSEIAFDMRKDVFVIFHDVAVCVDNE
jgi:hypothetical protein